MYKTIRHGETSLQYTILPQNDHDGHNKISSSGRNCKNRHRKSIFKYLGFFFVCSIIVGAVLIPFLVSTNSMPRWILKSKDEFQDGGNNKYVKSHNLLSSTLPLLKPISTTSSLIDTTTSTTLLNEIKLIPSKNSSVSFYESKIKNIEPTTKEYDKSSNGLNSYLNSRNKIIDKVSASTDRFQSNELKKSNNEKIISEKLKIKYMTTTNLESGIFTTLIPTTTINTSSTMETIKNSTVQLIVPKLNPTTSKYGHSKKRPFNLPSPVQKNIKKNPITAAKNFTSKGNVTESKWISSHWPYVDPSLYLQLTGYKSEKSILLPAITGAVLIIIVVIVTTCLITRNKRKILNNLRKRNQSNIDESCEDNTTLLNTSHASDEE